MISDPALRRSHTQHRPVAHALRHADLAVVSVRSGRLCGTVAGRMRGERGPNERIRREDPLRYFSASPVRIFRDSLRSVPLIFYFGSFFCADCLKQPTPKIGIFDVGCLR
jgi:hypothetical protein